MKLRNFFLVTGIVALLALPLPGYARMVAVNGDNVNLRSAPSTNARVIWRLSTGYPLQVIARRGKWYKVVDFEGDKGWLYKPLTTGTPHMVVKRKIVNIRSGPGTRYRIVGKAQYGVVFRTLQRGKNWVKVRHADGVTGWVYRKGLWGW